MSNVIIMYYYVVVKVDISMLLMSYASVLVGCGKRRSGLASAPLDVEYDNNSIEI